MVCSLFASMVLSNVRMFGFVLLDSILQHVSSI